MQWYWTAAPSSLRRRLAGRCKSSSAMLKETHPRGGPTALTTALGVPLLRSRLACVRPYSTSRRSEAFGLYACGVMSEFYEHRRHRLYQRCRAANEDERMLLGGPADLLEHLPVYAAAVGLPAWGLGVCERVEHLKRSILRRQVI